MKANRPFISVVAPIYGVEEYLERAIDCILSQTFGDFELVLVDDASPDDCPSLCDKAAAQNGKIKVVRHPENRGLSEARNSGLTAATGKYVWFFDPDDYVDADLFEKIKNAADETPAEVFLFGLTEEYANEHGRIGSTKTIVPEDKYLTDENAVRKEILALEKSTLFGYAWNKVYDLDMLKDRGLLFKDVPLIEDVDFNLRVFEDVARLRTVNAAPYHYNRRQSGSLSLKYHDNYYDLNRMRISMLFDRFSAWGFCDDTTRGELAVLYTRYIYSTITRSFDKLPKEDKNTRREWLLSVFEDRLFCDTIPYGRPKSLSLKIMIKALQKHRVKTAFAIGRIIRAVKQRLPMLFSKLKHGK